MKNITNKHVLITGATKGIGFATAQLFYQKGAIVYLLGRDFSHVNQTEDSHFNYIVCDITDGSNVKDILQNLSIDVLINCAAITQDNLLLRMSQSEWDNVINTNLNGTFRCIKAVLPNMIRKKNGCIINISSISARGNPGQANYSASKGAIESLTRTLAKEYAAKNIRFNCVAPGFIDTDMIKQMKGDILEMIPLKRLGTTLEVAESILFLVTNSYITGVVLPVDGGTLI